jgi:hypothetical protein
LQATVGSVAVDDNMLRQSMREQLRAAGPWFLITEVDDADTSPGVQESEARSPPEPSEAAEATDANTEAKDASPEAKGASSSTASEATEAPPTASEATEAPGPEAGSGTPNASSASSMNIVELGRAHRLELRALGLPLDPIAYAMDFAETLQRRQRITVPMLSTYTPTP